MTKEKMLNFIEKTGTDRKCNEWGCPYNRNGVCTNDIAANECDDEAIERIHNNRAALYADNKA